jgi:hypothetical protein
MRKLIAGMAVLALWAGAASAQNAPNSSVTTTQQTIDSRGVETNAKDTYDKSQSITSGNGALSAKTSTETTSQSRISAPPPVVTKSTTTTSATDDISH